MLTLYLTNSLTAYKTFFLIQHNLAIASPLDQKIFQYVDPYAKINKGRHASMDLDIRGPSLFGNEDLYFKVSLGGRKVFPRGKECNHLSGYCQFRYWSNIAISN